MLTDIASLICIAVHQTHFLGKHFEKYIFLLRESTKFVLIFPSFMFFFSRFSTERVTDVEIIISFTIYAYHIQQYFLYFGLGLKFSHQEGSSLEIKSYNLQNTQIYPTK